MSRDEVGSVLCVANYPSDEGYAWWLMENFWVQLGEMAEERGGRALVAYPEVRAVSEVVERSPLQVVEMEIPGAIGDTKALKRLFHDNDVRTLYLTDRRYFTPLYSLFRSWGVRSIIVHDHTPGERSVASGVRRILKSGVHRAGVFSADLYIGVSEFVYERFLSSGCLPAERCTFVRNGIPLRDPELDKDVRAEFDLPADARVVVSCGRMTRYKGIDFIIDCAEELLGREGFDDVHFVHLGDGPRRGAFGEQVVRAGLEGRVHLVGRRSDVRALLASCDLAFHASQGEAFSLALLEFMEAGLPVIAPDNCGNGEAIRHGTDGLLYETRDLSQAVTALSRLLTDDEERERFGRSATDRVRREFTLEEMNRRFRAVVGGVLDLD